MMSAKGLVVINLCRHIQISRVFIFLRQISFIASHTRTSFIQFTCIFILIINIIRGLEVFGKNIAGIVTGTTIQPQTFHPGNIQLEGNRTLKGCGLYIPCSAGIADHIQDIFTPTVRHQLIGSGPIRLPAGQI